MAHINRLNALKVAREKRPGRYADGRGLYLQIGQGNARSWILRYERDGHERFCGLGPAHLISLADARERADQARRQLIDGIDPIDAKRQRQMAARLTVAKTTTFDQAAERYIEAHKAGWFNEKHADQWRATLKNYASPIFGSHRVDAVDTDLVLKVLEPIWSTKAETASRLRGRIESVLDWAKARKLRDGENPARWRGHLDMLLPKTSKVSRVAHRPALPFAEIGIVMAALRVREGVASAALEFLILTATRSGETRGARWEEIDEDWAGWTVPKERTKNKKRDHRVPLSDAARAVLKRMALIGQSGLIFPGVGGAKTLSENTFGKVLKTMGHDPKLVVAHGFRSTFRDWTAEQTNFSNEVAEMALGHVIKGQAEAAYRRGDLYEKRRRLMEAWAGYCARQPIERDEVVVALRA